MLAAIITPAANPRKIRWTVGSGRLRKKNTVAAPRAVIKKVKPLPPAAHRSACVNMRFLSRRGGGLLSGKRGKTPGDLPVRTAVMRLCRFSL